MTVSAPSLDASPRMKLLPVLLSLVAGSADVIGFLGLRGLFVAHITGNLIILAAHLVTGTRVGVATILSVPVFISVLVLARLLVSALEAAGRASLRPLLFLQLLFLAGFLALGASAGPHVDPNAATAVLAGMLGVTALAVQNALVQMSISGVPSTAVMTTNLTRLTMDLGQLLLEHDSEAASAARRRAAHTWPSIVAFVAGAASGAALFAAVALWSLALPTSFGLIAFLVSVDGCCDRVWFRIQGQPGAASDQHRHQGRPVSRNEQTVTGG